VLNSRIKELIRSTFFVTCGALLCAFILIPGLSRFFMDLSYTGPLAGFSGRAQLLRDAILLTAAFSTSGVLMALFIGYFFRQKEMTLTLFAAVVVAIYYSIKISNMLLTAPDMPKRFLHLRMLELAVHMISLVGFAALGAWLVGKRRRKVKLKSDTPAISNSE
jgi:hypothetical protein